MCAQEGRGDNSEYRRASQTCRSVARHDCDHLPRSACDKYRLCCRLGARGGAARFPVQDPLHGLRASRGKQGQSHLRKLEGQGYVTCATVINFNSLSLKR